MIRVEKKLKEKIEGIKMQNQFSRTEMLIGEEGITRLQNAHVAIFGLGGVGGYVVEGLVRAGIGSFDLIDDDKICLSNLNRQLIATHQTIGKYKADVMKERILEINPQAKVTIHRCFYLPETGGQFDFAKYAYVVDAIDTVTGKLEIIMRAKEVGVPIISCMGTGNKIYPEMLRIGDIYQSSMCPLAKVMRNELRKRKVLDLKVLYSKEKPLTCANEGPDANGKWDFGEVIEQKIPGKIFTGRRGLPGSVSFVPSVAGLMIAGEIVRDLIEIKKSKED